MEPETVVLTGMRTFNTLIQSMGVDVRVFILAETADNCYISGDMGLRMTYKRSGLKGSGVEVDLGDFNNIMLENPTILRPNKTKGDQKAANEQAEKEAAAAAAEEDSAMIDLCNDDDENRNDGGGDAQAFNGGPKVKRVRLDNSLNTASSSTSNIAVTDESSIRDVPVSSQEGGGPISSQQLLTSRDTVAQLKNNLQDTLAKKRNMISAKRGPEDGSVSYPANALSSYPASSSASSSVIHPTSFLEGKRWSQLTPTEVANMIKRDQHVERQRWEKRNKEELERKKKEEEELRRKQEEERKRIEAIEEVKRKEAEEKKSKEEAERKRKFEAEKKRKEEAAERKRKEAEERKRIQEEVSKKKFEEEKKRREEVERKRIQEEERKRKFEEEKKMREEVERKRKESEERKRKELEDEKRRKEEEERKRREAERARSASHHSKMASHSPIIPQKGSSLKPLMASPRHPYRGGPSSSTSSLPLPHPHPFNTNSSRPGEEISNQVATFESSIPVNNLLDEVERFSLIFDSPESYVSATEKIITLLSSTQSPNITAITHALFNRLPQNHGSRKSLFEFLLISQFIPDTPIVVLCLGLEYFEPCYAGATLVNSLARNLISEMGLYLDAINEATAEIAVNFVASLLGVGNAAIAQAVMEAFGFKSATTIYNRLKHEDLISLVKDVCLKKNLAFPNAFLKFHIHTRVDIVVGWFKKGEIERNEIILYFEEYVKNGDRDLAERALNALVTPFASLAAFLESKWNVANALTKKSIRSNMTKSLPLTAQKCNDNADLHALVGQAGTHHISDLVQWQEASSKMRKSGIISIAIGEALSPTSPKRTLGAVAFFCKWDEKSRVGNLYFIQPSLCGEDLCETIFHELEDILQPSSKKKILLFTDSVFEIQEFAFLKQQLDQRWILDSSRMIPTNGRPATMEALCEAVTGASMCNRTRQTLWSLPGGQVALQHLGIRCVIVMEYAIRDRKLKAPEMNQLRQTLIEDWRLKFGLGSS